MKYFGTDGIRKEADKFTPDFLGSIVAGLADYAKLSVKDHKAKILLGGDTRESTKQILETLATSLAAHDLECASVGVLPTPAINYCFYKMGFDFAIDVTASHNPFTDNGIKIFERGETSGIKLSSKGVELIEAAIENHTQATPTTIASCKDLHDGAISLYTDHVLDYLGDVDLSDLHIGMDCANGAVSVINKTIFERLGASVQLINANSNFNRTINLNCGSTHLEQLKSLVQENSLDFGVAYDGDGDRTLLIDHLGHEIDGDEIIAILAHYLNLDQIAVTVMANQGLLNCAAASNIKTEITPVGDSNVAAAMHTHNIKLGGEQSGHIILPGEPTGDGMLTSLMVAKVVATTHSSLHDLAAIITKLPQVILNVPATPEQKTAVTKNPAYNSIISQFEEKVKTVQGRLLVRPSGTEPLIRITVWGDDKDKIATLANELKTKLGEIL